MAELLYDINQPYTSALLATLGAVLNVPCNFGDDDGTFDEYMLIHYEAWCESNCGNVPPGECWRRLLEAKAQEKGISL